MVSGTIGKTPFFSALITSSALLDKLYCRGMGGGAMGGEMWSVMTGQPDWKNIPNPSLFLHRWCCWLAVKDVAARYRARSQWCPSALS